MNWNHRYVVKIYHRSFGKMVLSRTDSPKKVVKCIREAANNRWDVWIEGV